MTRRKSIDIAVEDAGPGMLLNFMMRCELRQAGLFRN
jgi:hypothetical protein